MNFRDYTVENIDRIVMIREELRKRFGAIDRDIELIMVKAAIEPWGLLRVRQQKGEGNSSVTGNSKTQKSGSAMSTNTNSSSGNGKDHRNERKQSNPISPKQLNIIQEHLSGKLGQKIAVLIAETGRPLDRLTSSEASKIITFIFGGGR